MRSELEEIQRKTAPVFKRHGVTRAGLFGSLVRGEVQESSDIDILIELGREKSLLDLVALKLELEEVLETEVDIVEYSTIHPLLKDRILGEQVPLL